MARRKKGLESRRDSQSRLTVGNLIDRYLEVPHISGNQSRPTISQCNRLNSQFGACPVQDLSPALVCQYRDSRLQVATPATVTRELAVFKRILNLAVKEWGLIQVNPIAGVANPKGANKRIRWITKEEEVLLMDIAPSWLCPVFKFAIETGLRRSEVLDLKWEDVYLQERYFVVAKSKNGERRGCPLNDVAMKILLDFTDHTGFVFRNEHGGRISENALEYTWRKTVRDAKLENLHWHDATRHTWASRAVQRGVDLYSVQLILGHKSPAMSQRYSHHSMDSLRHAVGG